MEGKGTEKEKGNAMFQVRIYTVTTSFEKDDEAQQMFLSEEAARKFAKQYEKYNCNIEIWQGKAPGSPFVYRIYCKRVSDEIIRREER